MRETAFIAQKKEEWQSFERLLLLDESDPERLGDLYVQVTDDLSYARTFYPNRSVRVYLNGLAQQVFVKTYKNKAFSLHGVLVFWREELPDLLWHSRKVIGWATLIFILFFLVGWFSSTLNPDFDRIILGESYIAATKANIAKGDPLAIYKGSNEFDMFFQIGLNNLRVDFMTFGLGVLYGIGAVLIMIYNAIMTGTFQHFFYANGGFTESLFTIWVHGAFEISAMVLSCAAGMELGRGLVFPETYSRLQAFQISAQRGFKILVGVLLLTVIAAFNESFLTRHTDAPYLIRGAIIVLSFGFVFTYFIYYPYRRYKAGLVKPPKVPDIAPNNFRNIDWQAIKSSGEVAKEAVWVFRKNRSSIGWFSVIGSVFYVLGLLVFVGGKLEGTVLFRTINFFNVFNSSVNFLAHWRNIAQFWAFDRLPHYFPVASFLFFSLLTCKIQHILHLERSKTGIEGSFRDFLTENARIFRLSMPVLCLTGLLFIKMIGIFLFFSILPIALSWQSVIATQPKNPFSALASTGRLMRQGGFQVVFISGAILLFVFLGMAIISSPLMDLVIDFVQWNLRLRDGDGIVIMRYGLTFLVQVMLGFATALLSFTLAIQAAVLVEQTEATSLRKQIEQLGTTRDLRGLVRE